MHYVLQSLLLVLAAQRAGVEAQSTARCPARSVTGARLSALPADPAAATLVLRFVTWGNSAGKHMRPRAAARAARRTPAHPFA